MSQTLEVSFLEINALNKLLGQIKFGCELSADEVDMYALSPFITSLFKKVHQEYKDQIRDQLSTGEIQTLESVERFDPMDDFHLADNHYIKAIMNRIKGWSDERQNHLKTLNEQQREEYCDLIFAPFKPTSKQKDEVMNILVEIANGSN